jgi:PAS domain S-box-containing protein
MLVDDVALERRLMRRVLERSGRFEVTGEAGDGREAVDMVAEVAPDLILLDLSMPGMDGLEALPLLLEASPGTKVVVLSGLSASQAAEPALRAGAHGYMEKGLHPNEIVAHVMALLDGPGASRVPSTPVGLPEFSGVLQAASSELFMDPALLHRRILDALQEGVVVQDRNGAVRAANLSAQRTLGLRPDNLLGRLSWNGDWQAIDASGVALAPEEHPAMVALRTGEPQLSITVGIERSDGGRRWLQVNAVPLSESGSSTAQAVVSSFIDVTDTHAAQLASQRLAAVIELTPDGVDTLDVDGTLTTWNAGAEELYGFSAAEIIGRNKRVVIPADRLEEFDDTLRRVAAGERIASQETTRLRRDGTRIDVSLSVSAIRDRDARLIGYSSITRDVSDAVRLATALHDSEELLRLAQEHSSIGMALVSLDGTWLTVNPALCRIVGRSKHELLQLRFQDITHPDDLGVGREGTLRLIAGEIDGHTVEKRYLHGDGRTVWVQIDGSLVRDADGAPRHLIAQVQDITERKRSQELLDLLFTASPDLLCIAGTEGRLIRVNPSWSKVLGWSAEELTSRPLADFLHPDDLAATAEEYDGLLGDQGETVEFENRFRTVTGTYRWLQWNTMKLPGEGLMVCNARDMTAHKEREAMLEHQRTELARSNADLEQFAYVTSHDLQEPLRAVASYSQLLMRRYSDRLDGDALRFIERSVAAVGRMQALIRDLLQYARLGTRPHLFAQTDCETVLNEVLEDLQASIAETGAQVTHDPLPSLPADRSRFRQLLQNLIGNAIKFRGSNPPQVHVAARREGGNWLFRVRDNGIGIEQEYSERVFVIFQRLHSRRAYAGTGVGLAVCKRIVEQHGGRIWIEPSPRTGTTVCFNLPVQAAALDANGAGPELGESQEAVG